MAIVPKNKPLKSQAEVLDFLKKKKIDTSKLCLLAVRGYYRDSIGKKGVKDTWEKEVKIRSVILVPIFPFEYDIKSFSFVYSHRGQVGLP